VRSGSYVFDYGNNLRGEAEEAGVEDAFTYPGFVPAYIRPLFCHGIGPFRWAALSGEAGDIEAIDQALLDLFPEDGAPQRWLQLAPGRIAFQGLPARICWLGYGARARAGLAINDLVRAGRVKAPVVIGRDHLDSGPVASPFRETEAMRDGSDAIADWPILNALLNVAAGATRAPTTARPVVSWCATSRRSRRLPARTLRSAALRSETCAFSSTPSSSARTATSWRRARCATSSSHPETFRSSTGRVCVPFRASSTATRTRASPATGWTSSPCARPERATRSSMRRVAGSCRPS